MQFRSNKIEEGCVCSAECKIVCATVVIDDYDVGNLYATAGFRSFVQTCCLILKV